MKEVLTSSRKSRTKYAEMRGRLKVSLHVDRGLYFPGRGNRPVCPICDQPIMGIGEMHEALISKGMAPGPEQWRINDRRNCVIVHADCHKPGIGGDEQFSKCLDNLTLWEGADNIQAWLSAMKEYFPQTANEALVRVTGYVERNKNVP